MGSFEVEPLIKEKGGNIQEGQEECERRKRERDKIMLMTGYRKTFMIEQNVEKAYVYGHMTVTCYYITTVRSHDHTSISAVCYLLQ